MYRNEPKYIPENLSTPSYENQAHLQNCSWFYLARNLPHFVGKYNPQATSYHMLRFSHQTAANRVLNCCSAAVFKLVQITCKSKRQVRSPFFANMHSGSELQHCERLLPPFPLSLRIAT